METTMIGRPQYALPRDWKSLRERTYQMLSNIILLIFISYADEINDEY
jgi:hypothetical protein